MSTHLDVTESTTDADIERFSFEAFATAHPHEAHEAYPDRFWEFFHAQCPRLSREEMRSLLGIPEQP